MDEDVVIVIHDSPTQTTVKKTATTQHKLTLDKRPNPSSTSSSLKQTKTKKKKQLTATPAAWIVRVKGERKGCNIPSFVPPDEAPEDGKKCTFLVTNEDDLDILRAIEIRAGLSLKIEPADAARARQLPVKRNLINLKTLVDIFWEQRIKLKALEDRLDKQIKDISNAKEKMLYSVSEIDKLFL